MPEFLFFNFNYQYQRELFFERERHLFGNKKTGISKLLSEKGLKVFRKTISIKDVIGFWNPNSFTLLIMKEKDINRIQKEIDSGKIKD